MSMRESSQNFLVGLTSIVAILGFVYLLISFGELEALLNPRYRLTIYTDNAAGLRPGSQVEYNGVPIGVVDDISISEDPRFPVNIMIMIQQDQQIPLNITPYSMSSLFGGSAILELELAPDDSLVPGEYYPTDGSAQMYSPIRLKMIEQITAELDARMQPLIDALDSFKLLSETYMTFGENLNALITPESGEPLRLGEAFEQLETVLGQVSDALALANEWLGDEQLHSDVRGAVENAKAMIDKATGTMDRFTKLADQLEVDADTIVKGLLPVADDIAVTLEEIRRVTRLATEGHGTMAELLKNPDLYNSLDDAATRLERTLIEIQLYFEKIKAEGLDIDF